MQRAASLRSSRSWRRAHERWGDQIFMGFSKYGMHKKSNGQFTFGTRTPKPIRKLSKRIREKIKLAQHSGRMSEGMTKVRNLWLRAGLLVIPFGEAEMKAILQQAKNEFDTDGVIATDTAIKLSQSGYNIDQLDQLWTLMEKAEIDPSALNPDGDETVAEDEPLNNFD